MYRGTRQSPGGIAAKALAGLDCAFIDIKAVQKSRVAQDVTKSKKKTSKLKRKK